MMCVRVAIKGQVNDIGPRKAGIIGPIRILLSTLVYIREDRN